jgi:hypothetical protein
MIIETISSQCELAEERWKQKKWLEIDWWVIDQSDQNSYSSVLELEILNGEK